MIALISIGIIGGAVYIYQNGINAYLKEFGLNVYKVSLISGGIMLGYFLGVAIFG